MQKAKVRMNESGEGQLESRLNKLMEYLEEEGFMPEIEICGSGDKITVKECNCPFREVVKETRLPCKLEAIFYQKLFSEKVDRTSYIPDGDFSCTYEIPVSG